jgi:CDP-diacylglycerol--serine O-phosphatidyltransferase
MRYALAVLVAVHAPASAVAAVVAGMPAVEARVYAPLTAAPSAAFSSFSVSPLAAASLPLSAPAISAAPAAAAPLAAAPLALTPVALIAAPAAAPTADPRQALTALGASVADAPRAAPALARTFDFAGAPDSPEPTPTADTTGRPAPRLAPADAPRRVNWKAAVPNGLTMANMASGLAAAFLASDGKFVPAALAIIAANLFDAVDGRAARALKVDNPLGIDLDSLADVVSFGAAPALLVFKAALLPALGWWGFPLAAAFAGAGLYRLARFNVGAHAEKSGAAPAKASDSFTGLPIPGGAGVIVALVLALGSLPAALAAPVAAVVTVLAAAAMVSRLPYPAFKKKGLLPAVALGAAAAAVPAALGAYALIPAAVFGLYLASGPAVAALRRAR